MNCICFRFFRIIPNIKVAFYRKWNIVYFKLLGVKFGNDIQVNNKVYISGIGDIVIGNDFRFSSGDSINPICRNIRGAFYVPYKTSRIVIGNHVGMSSTCIWSSNSVIIGDNVNIGGDCLIMDHDAHPLDYLKRRRDYCNVKREDFRKLVPSAPIVIEDDVWIGARCQILKGVTIGARSIIAAGSVVTNTIPPDVIAGGIPCKIIRKL